MRVCIVTPEFPLKDSGGRGGVGTYSETLAKALLSRGVEVHVVIYSERAPARESNSEWPVHLHFVQLPWVRYFSSFFPGLWQSMRLWKFLRALDKQHRFEIFEMYNDEGITLFPVLFLKPRTAFRMHTSIRQHIVHKGETFNRRRNFSVRLDRTAARAALHLVTHSDFHAAEMASEYGLDQRRFVVIPHCTPPVSPRMMPTADCAVTYVGALDRRKGIDVFLEAAPLILKSCPTARVLVIGRDYGFDEGKSWKQWFESKFGAESRVEFAGSVSDKQLQALWERAGILVVPSRYESFGLTVIEGFARRLAVITTRAAALPEVAKGGAVLVEAGSSAALAEAVIQLLKDPTRAEFVGAQGYQTYLESYTPEIFADKILKLYARICGNGAA